MKTIKISISDSVFDKIMFFLSNLPKKDVKIEVEENQPKKRRHRFVHFFRSSPLVGEIDFERSKETYESRVKF